MGCLIEELYSSKAVNLIRDLYQSDPNAKMSFYNAFGHKILQSQNKILISSPLDILLFICSTAKFASSVEESNYIAVTVYKRVKETHPLPSLLLDKGLDFAEKTLISLCFFSPAMLKKWAFRGAPSPSFYRECAKQTFLNEGYNDVSYNFEKWELFFQEFFI